MKKKTMLALAWMCMLFMIALPRTASAVEWDGEKHEEVDSIDELIFRQGEDVMALSEGIRLAYRLPEGEKTPKQYEKEIISQDPIRTIEEGKTMRITTRGQYVMQVMVELAERQKAGKPTSLLQICEGSSLSRRYLERLLHPLVKSGVLRTSRGIRGGYMLTKEPEDYSVLEILEVTEGIALNPFPHCDSDAPGGAHHKLFKLWGGLDNHVRQYLKDLRLSDFMDGDSPRSPSAPEKTEKKNDSN